jgi:hypothetical protein
MPLNLGDDGAEAWAIEGVVEPLVLPPIIPELVGVGARDDEFRPPPEVGVDVPLCILNPMRWLLRLYGLGGRFEKEFIELFDDPWKFP